MSGPRVHETAEVSEEAVVGSGTRIWHFVQIREGAHIGRNCIIGKGTYIDFDVAIGDNVKIQNGCNVYHGATLEDGVFLGPGVVLTNDKRPRAVRPDGTLKTDADWSLGQVLIKRGAAIGARSVVLPDVSVGAFAMVGAGSVVTRDVPDYGLVWGNPARLQGFVCPCGARLWSGPLPERDTDGCTLTCPACGADICLSMGERCGMEER